MTLSAQQWIEDFAAALETEAPTEEEQAVLLELAGVAAHCAERIAAPISCWLVARSGCSPLRALEIASELADAEHT